MTTNSWEDRIVTGLKRNGVTFIAYLPDTPLSSLIETIERDDELTAVRVSREEEAVGILSGAWLGHSRGALLCQSSGLATAVNALGSLSKPARIPFVGLVTRRGNLGEFNLAQVPFGYNMPQILDTMGIRNESISDLKTVEQYVDLASKTAFSTEEPYMLLLESTVLGVKDEF